MNDESKSIMVNRTRTTIGAVVKSVLWPDEDISYIVPWKNFRNALISDEKMDALRRDKSFKWGVQIVLYIIDDMYEIDFERDAETIKNIKDRTSSYLIYDLKKYEDEDHQGVLKLIEALDILTSRPQDARKWDLKPEDVNDLQMRLNTIANCQRMLLNVTQCK